MAGWGVTPVTTKVELEEIRLKERGRKIKGGAGRGQEAERGERCAKHGLLVPDFPPEAPSRKPTGIFALRPHPGPRPVNEAGVGGMAAAS